MANEVDIANWALTLLGERQISDLSDDNENAELILGMWDMARDGLLRQSAWRFAIERTSLAVDVSTPAWGFDYQYTIAGDVVKVLQVSEFYPGVDMSDYRNSDLAPFRIEQSKILTNLGAPLYVKWLVNSIDIGMWDASFARLMAGDLAEAINPRIGDDERKSQRLAFWRQQAWMQAASANAIEDPPEAFADDSWMAAHAS